MKENPSKIHVFFKKYLTPVTIPLYAVFITVLSNFINTWYVSKNQHELEERKFQYSLYLNAFEHKEQDLAFEKLVFFNEIGLLDSIPSALIIRKEEKTIPIDQNYTGPILKYNEIYDGIFELGDINGDNISDTAAITKPFIVDDMNCMGGKCTLSFNFSDKKNKPLVIDDVPYASIESCIDVNSDGIRDLLVIREGFQGCWHGISIFVAVGKDWVEYFSSSLYGCGDDQQINKRIYKKNRKVVYLMDDTFDDNGKMLQKEIEISKK